MTTRSRQKKNTTTGEKETDEPEDNVDDDDNNDGEDKEGIDRPTRGSSMGRRRSIYMYFTCTSLFDLHVRGWVFYRVEGVVVVFGEVERWVSR